MTPDLTREDRVAAARVGARVRLADVRLRQVQAELHQPQPGPPLNLDLKVSPSVMRAEDVLVYNMGYEVSAATAGGEKAFEASLVLSVIYQIEAVEDVKDDDLPSFGNVCVVFTAHPYLREFLHALTGRMGLPPLVLDVVQSPLDADATA